MTNYDIQALDLTGDEYVVTQSIIRNKYKAEDAQGNVVLRGKQKRLTLKEEFPFETGDGQPAFTVKAAGILDVAGNYAITDAQTEEPILVLDQNWTYLTHKWKLRDPTTEALVATIESESTLVDALRAISDIFSLIPHKYEIRDADGDHVGRIAGHFSLKDKYTVTIDDASDIPKEAVLAAAMVIDAIEGN